ncbi:hypothetical protein B0H16DRAFT_1570063 [Mycena metata]|uniref:Secreted protein n=1 Tax=Mycena metata TaxID=1033252 RepID=A0AAD7MYI7_9AGAR|nr:hypothetical protein B0H16DRAFT_1570063 [Mycena metata]
MRNFAWWVCWCARLRVHAAGSCSELMFRNLEQNASDNAKPESHRGPYFGLEAERCQHRGLVLAWSRMSDLIGDRN